GLGSAALLLNREPNDGKRVALVTTDPPGANVAFVPVNPVSGDVIPSELEHASGVTPLRHRLRPATYLVVVYFEDDPTRFHEGYRKIPLNTEDNYGGYRHLSSRILENGDIKWAEIEIPDPSAFSDMARVTGPAKYLSGIVGSTLVPPAMCSIPGFLIDPFEFTVADYSRVTGQLKPPNIPSQVRLGPRQAVNISWNDAICRAEDAGKRLLHEYEYEYVATAFGKHVYPWGDELPEGFTEMDHLGDVGTPSFDRIRVGGVDVYNLFSNVAKWVQTMVPLYPEQEEVFARMAVGDRGERGIRGWFSPGNLSSLGERIGPRQRASKSCIGIYTSIGFRCGRSLKPRLRPEDFVSYHATALPNFKLPSANGPGDTGK
ncbi:MAG: SUMF1/EgtB/PvdO family nonheme iron enzyme, partial [Planctomycetaceae bacterium]|nr:SUMF1/EgtB/PvdO family nonheme iron enzyme [Planctomycetaceae bacterium]